MISNEHEHQGCRKEVAAGNVKLLRERAYNHVCTTTSIWVEAKKQRYGVTLKVQLSRKLNELFLSYILGILCLAISQNQQSTVGKKDLNHRC